VARVAVVGGGIAGATIALFRARRGDEVTLFEASPVLGGQLSTLRDGGFVVEQGAEGFVAGSEAVAALAAELGMGARIVGQLTTQSYAFDGAALHELARGEAAQFLGFQVPQRALGQGIRAFETGMSELVESLSQKLRTIADVRVSSPVKELTLRAGAPVIRAGDGELVVERVFVATSAQRAAELLAPSFGAPAAALGSVRTVSSVTVSLAYRRGAIEHPLDGTGFVVAEGAQHDGFRACTFTTSKLAARAPDGYVLLRAFFRPSDDDLATFDDAAWARRAERGIAAVLAPLASPERAWVARWPAALPVFDAEHRARVAALEAEISGSGVFVAGAAFHGSGIDGALVSARRVAEHSV
jgi:oxygen-dependent protoporphyrinogen oxidase